MIYLVVLISVLEDFKGFLKNFYICLREEQI